MPSRSPDRHSDRRREGRHNRDCRDYSREHRSSQPPSRPPSGVSGATRATGGSRHSRDRESETRDRKRHGDRDRDRDRERERDKHRDRQRSRSRSPSRKKRSRSPQNQRVFKSDERIKEEMDLKEEKFEVKVKPEPGPGFGGINVRKASELLAEPPAKEAPNFEVSGKLLEDTNVFNGVVVKYSEPEEARKPRQRWRFYVFKGEEVLPVLHLHRQSAFLIGKDRKVCDLPVDHPSCSRQHAVLQYRLVHREREDGSKANKILPYIIDLGSSNGTYLNGDRIEPKRYVELKEKDVLKFGYSSREYVLLHEDSRGPKGSDVESE